jgi:hypothetical protein
MILNIISLINLPVINCLKNKEKVLLSNRLLIKIKISQVAY